MKARTHGPQRITVSAALWLGAALLGALLWTAPGGAALAQSAKPAAKGKNYCVDCHSDARFLVQNRKLYEYFQGWKTSVHAVNDVTCADCHGGNPKAKDKRSAHAGEVMGSASRASPINYRNIPNTCARCHKRIFARFKLSAHYEHLKATNVESQGPTCVTCHGSVNTTVLNVNTVRGTCEQCHNEDTRNNPDIPDKAEHVLNHFLSISRYYRMIALRSTPEEAQAFFRVVDPLIQELNAEWHSFDIKKIEAKTNDVVQFMKIRRNALLEEAKARKK